MSNGRNDSLFGDNGKRKQATDIIKKQLKTSEADFIPFLQGRPKRLGGLAGVITSDDVLNLSIALNTTKTFEQFLAIV